MAVEIQETSASFIGTGVLSVYAPLFYASDSDQVHVYVNGGLQTVGDDYTLNGLGSADGCNVQATFALNSTIYIERLTPITQEVDTQNNETILEDVLDGEFDKLTMIAQEQQTQIARTVQVPKGEDGILLPALALRANKLLVSDAAGNLTPLVAPEQVVYLDPNNKPQGVSLIAVFEQIGIPVYDEGDWLLAGPFNDEGAWG